MRCLASVVFPVLGLQREKTKFVGKERIAAHPNRLGLCGGSAK
jgi:hypothetical protein